MTENARFPFRSLAATALAAVFLVPACKDKDKETPAFDAGVTETAADAGGEPVDLSKCAGCGSVALRTWAFTGKFRDAACTEPVAHLAPGACEPVPELGGEIMVTYVEEVGSRKAGEVATVALGEQVAPDSPRYRRSGTTCVQDDEGGMNLAPAGCIGQRVCRDEAGAIVCDGCRTLANGCPDFQASRVFALLNDPAAKADAKPAAGGGGGGNLARLRQCCTALGAEANRLGSSPEAGVLRTAATQCAALVSQAGPSGNAPEMGVVRTLLAGRKVPAVCAGF
jgi:hypothetical protein